METQNKECRPLRPVTPTASPTFSCLAHHLQGWHHQIPVRTMPRQPPTHQLPRHHCDHCGQGFPTLTGVQRHIGHSPCCQAATLQKTMGGQRRVVNDQSNHRQEEVDLPNGELEHCDFAWDEGGLDGPDSPGCSTPEPPQSEPLAQ